MLTENLVILTFIQAVRQEFQEEKAIDRPGEVLYTYTVQNRIF